MREEYPDILKINRVLVTKLLHYGDVLLTSPVFTVLKNHYPHLEIDALIYKNTKKILDFHPAINQIHVIDQNWKKHNLITRIQAEYNLLSKLKARHYDLMIHLTKSNRGELLRNFCRIKLMVAPQPRTKQLIWHKPFSYYYPLLPGNTRHTVESNLDALRRIGIYPNQEERALVFIPGIDAELYVKNLLVTHKLIRKNFIHFHPGSRWLFKCWSLENNVALINMLQDTGHQIVITAAPDAQEIELINAIINSLTKPVINVAGTLDLKQLAALIAQSKVFVGVDSAPMHIAAAMKIPTVVLFGPSGEKEWGPWMTANKILTSNHSCRPCGNDGCGGGKHSECLSAITPTTVFNAINCLFNDESATQ